MIGISAFVAVLIRRRASILAGARAGLRRFGAGRILPAMETPE
jgi:hypothetical protein